jgi:hypothetical protein
MCAPRVSKLGRLEPVAGAMRVVFRETFRQRLGPAPYLEVVGCDGSLNREQCDFDPSRYAPDSDYPASETEFALELTSWTQWLGVSIDAATLDEHAPETIVGHCLFEMTFFGFEPNDVEARRLRLAQDFAAIDAMSEPSI